MNWIQNLNISTRQWLNLVLSALIMGAVVSVGLSTNTNNLALTENVLEIQTKKTAKVIQIKTEYDVLLRQIDAYLFEQNEETNLQFNEQMTKMIDLIEKTVIDFGGDVRRNNDGYLKIRGVNEPKNAEIIDSLMPLDRLFIDLRKAINSKVFLQNQIVRNFTFGIEPSSEKMMMELEPLLQEATQSLNIPQLRRIEKLQSRIAASNILSYRMAILQKIGLYDEFHASGLGDSVSSDVRKLLAIQYRKKSLKSHARAFSDIRKEYIDNIADLKDDLQTSKLNDSNIFNLKRNGNISILQLEMLLEADSLKSIKQLEAESKEGVSQLISLSIIGLSILVLLNLLVTRSIIKPLSMLKEMITEISDTGRFNRWHAISGNNEFTQMNNGVGRLLEQIHLLIEEIQTVNNNLAKGDFSQKMSSSYRGDLDDLSQTYNLSVENISQTINQIQQVSLALAQGEFEKEIDTSASRGQYFEVLSSLNTATETQKQSVNAIREVTEKMHEGDFSDRIRFDMPGELAVLKLYLNETLERLQSLSVLTKSIAEGSDISLRLPSDAGNEVGILYERFNEMLERIQQRESELKQHQDNLELLVQQRTYQLQKAQQKAEAANQAKSEFLANMSHEIRTPMNAVMGLTHLTMKTHLTKQQKDYLEKIHYSAENLLGIINDILDFSKIEAGKLEIENVAFNLKKEVLKSVQTIIEQQANSKGLELKTDFPSDLPKTIVTDPVRLKQILINLLNNAVKFTEKGYIKLKVHVDHHAKDNCVLKFEVEDSGIGMTQQQQDKLFKSFSQADTSTTRKYGGTGLGLSISKRLTELMGGEIGSHSEYSKGSTFWFTISAGIAKKSTHFDEKDKSYGVADTKMDYRNRFKGYKVLLIEDNEINQQIAQEILEMAGIKVSLANDGAQGLKQLEKVLSKGSKPFDLVLCDLQMPVMDGYETITELRKLEQYAELPVIAMTANVMKKDIDRALDLGMNGFVYKPIDLGNLFDTLQKWLDPQAENDPADENEHSQNFDAETEKELSDQLGYDVSQGLKRVFGNINLYKSLLHAFYKQNKTTPSDIERVLKAKDYAEARALVHRLKGVAGNLGADQFFTISEVFEQKLANQEVEQILALKNEYLTLLRDLLDRVEQVEDHTDGSILRTEAVSDSEKQSLVLKLMPLLEEMDSDALDVFEQSKNKFASFLTKDEIIEIEDEIAQFDFESAIKILQRHV